MNTLGNARYHLTEEAIEKAVFSVLRRKSYDSFTIKDICAEAKINRSTFYAHYQDINELMIKIEGKLVSELQVICKLEQVFNNQNVFLKMAEFIKENKAFYKAFLKSNNPSFTAPIMMEEQKAAFREISLSKNINYSESELDYHQQFFAAGLKAVFERWLFKDCLETPEQIAKIIHDEYANNAKHV